MFGQWFAKLVGKGQARLFSREVTTVFSRFGHNSKKYGRVALEFFKANGKLILGASGMTYLTIKLLSKTEGECVAKYGHDRTSSSIATINRASFTASKALAIRCLDKLAFSSLHQKQDKTRVAGDLADAILSLMSTIPDEDSRDYFAACLRDGVNLHNLGLEIELGFSDETTIRSQLVGRSKTDVDTLDNSLRTAVRFAEQGIPLAASF